MNDPLEQHRALAGVLHLHGVVCPGPREGLVLTTILGQLDDALRRPTTPPSVRRALEAYRDGLVVVAGIWLEQQRLIIDRVEAMIGGAQ